MELILQEGPLPKLGHVCVKIPSQLSIGNPPIEVPPMSALIRRESFLRDQSGAPTGSLTAHQGAVIILSSIRPTALSATTLEI